MFTPLCLEAHNPSPMTGRGNNTYLIAGEGGAALIDAGVGEPGYLSDLDAALAASGAALRQVLVTHAHADHAAGAPALAARYPAARFAKYPWPEEDVKYAVDWEPLGDGTRIDLGTDSLVVLHTPGHSPDHLAFWHEASATIFTGDLVVLGSSVMIHWSRGGSLAQYLQSLERLRDLSPRQLLPAHGAAIDEPAAVLTGYLDHRRLREQQVVAALRAGPGTVETIAESIYHGLAPALMPAARENVRAHLEKLREEGRAATDDRTEIWTAS